MFQNKTIHFIGIGGISMSGIAMIAKSLGAKVTGSDIAESELTENLKKELQKSIHLLLSNFCKSSQYSQKLIT